MSQPLTPDPDFDIDINNLIVVSTGSGTSTVDTTFLFPSSTIPRWVFLGVDCWPTAIKSSIGLTSG
jgi:hypothetical protein